MDKDRIFKGTWFLPYEEEETFSGTFSYSRSEGCYLEILGGFEDFSLITRRHNIILGETLDGGKLTLVDCIREYRKSNFNGITVSKYFATFAFIGNHYKNKDLLIFDDLWLSLCDIETWVGIFGFNKLNIDFTNKAIDIQYKAPQKISFDITDSVQIYFDFGQSFPVNRQSPVAEIVQTTSVGIKLIGQVPFMEILQYHFTLYKFISLCYFDSPYVIRIFLKDSSTSNSEINENLNVELLYLDHFFNKSYKVGKEHYKFLFTYPDVKYSFSSIIKLWFQLFDKISPAVNLLNGLLLKKEYALELKFISAIQALETFHRNIIGGEDIPKDKHEARLKLILENVPEEYREWLKIKLEFSNEPNLRKRLKELCDRIPVEVVSKLIKNKKHFINGVVNSRNYYTHYSDSSKGKTMSASEISKAVEKLKILLICSILNELQLSKDQIIEFVQIDKVYPFAEL